MNLMARAIGDNANDQGRIRLDEMVLSDQLLLTRRA
jgi:hypothetical protein